MAKREPRRTPLRRIPRNLTAPSSWNLTVFPGIGLASLFVRLLLQLEQPRVRTLFSCAWVLSMGFSWWLAERRRKPSMSRLPTCPELCFLAAPDALLIIWNYLFWLYISEVDFTRDFSIRFRTFALHCIVIFRCRRQNSSSIITCCRPFLRLFATEPPKKGIEGWGISFPLSSFSCCPSSLASQDHVSRLTEWMASYGGFTPGLNLFADIPDSASQLYINMGQLGVHSKALFPRALPYS